MSRKGQAEWEAEKARAKVRLQWTLLAMVVLGPVLALGAGGHRWRQAERAERLRAEGEGVVATVTDYALGTGRGAMMDTMDLSYAYEGRTYQDRINCGGLFGCTQAPDPTIRVWVDPDDPASFVAENGDTDETYIFLGGMSIFPGSMLFIIGGILLTVVGGGLPVLFAKVDRAGSATPRRRKSARPGKVKASRWGRGRSRTRRPRR